MLKSTSPRFYALQEKLYELREQCVNYSIGWDVENQVILELWFQEDVVTMEMEAFKKDNGDLIPLSAFTSNIVPLSMEEFKGNLVPLSAFNSKIVMEESNLEADGVYQGRCRGRSVGVVCFLKLLKQTAIQSSFQQ